MGEDGQLVDVVAHVAAESDLVAKAVGEGGIDKSEAPERGPEAAGRVRLTRLGPELAGDRRAWAWAIGECKAGQEPLLGPRQVANVIVDRQAEAAQELEDAAALASLAAVAGLAAVACLAAVSRLMVRA